MRKYRVYAIGEQRSAETIEAESGFDARKVFARTHGKPVGDVVAIRIREEADGPQA